MCKDKQVKLLIVGAGFYSSDIVDDYMLELKREAEDIKDKIIFTGYIDYEDMPSIYQLSNIAVLPSMWDEPAGMTMVEAVASGLPLITTNSGGIPEYIPNKLAVILNRDDKLVENITENILNLKQNGWEEDQHSLNQFRSEMCLRHYYQEFSNIINKR